MYKFYKFCESIPETHEFTLIVTFFWYALRIQTSDYSSDLLNLKVILIYYLQKVCLIIRVHVLKPSVIRLRLWYHLVMFFILFSHHAGYRFYFSVGAFF